MSSSPKDACPKCKGPPAKSPSYPGMLYCPNSLCDMDVVWPPTPKDDTKLTREERLEIINQYERENRGRGGFYVTLPCSAWILEYARAQVESGGREAKWVDGVLMNCYECGTQLVIACPKCAPELTGTTPQEAGSGSGERPDEIDAYAKAAEKSPQEKPHKNASELAEQLEFMAKVIGCYGVPHFYLETCEEAAKALTRLATPYPVASTPQGETGEREKCPECNDTGYADDMVPCVVCGFHVRAVQMQGDALIERLRAHEEVNYLYGGDYVRSEICQEAADELEACHKAIAHGVSQAKEAQSTIHSLTEQVTALTDKLEGERKLAADIVGQYERADAKLQTQVSTVRELRAALEPFARYADATEEMFDWAGDGEIGEMIVGGLRRSIRLSDLRKARSALGGGRTG